MFPSALDDKELMLMILIRRRKTNLDFKKEICDLRLHLPQDSRAIKSLAHRWGPCGKLFIPQKWNIFPQKWNNSPSLSKVCPLSQKWNNSPSLLNVCPLSQKWNNSPSLLNVCSLSRIQIWIKFIVKMKQFSLSFEGLSPLSAKGQKEARRAAD